MEFGEQFVGCNHLVERNHELLNGKFRNIYTFPIFKFIFERPDDGKFIIEGNHGLYQVDKENLLPLHEDSLTALKEMLAVKYSDLLNKQEQERVSLIEDLDKAKKKVEELESSINHLVKINETSFTNNRLSSIGQQSKSLRKHQRRMKAIDEMMAEKQAKVKDLKEEHQISVERLENQLREALAHC